YLVLPESLVQLFRKGKEVHDAGSSTLDQATAAIFIEEGFFSTHVRRMRKLYRERLEVFLLEAEKCRSGWVKFAVIEAGMDATGLLMLGHDDVSLAKRLAASGIDVPPLSSYSIKSCASGLVFGFTAFPPSQIRSSMLAVAKTIGV